MRFLHFSFFTALLCLSQVVLAGPVVETVYLNSNRHLNGCGPQASIQISSFAGGFKIHVQEANYCPNIMFISSSNLGAGVVERIPLNSNRNVTHSFIVNESTLPLSSRNFRFEMRDVRNPVAVIDVKFREVAPVSIAPVPAAPLCHVFPTALNGYPARVVDAGRASSTVYRENCLATLESYARSGNCAMTQTAIRACY